MKKIWFLGLLLAANFSYAQVSIQKHSYHMGQKDSMLYLWQDFILQQTVEFPDTFNCDGTYFLPHDDDKKSIPLTRCYSKRMDSMSIQGVPYDNDNMLRAVLSVVQGRASRVVYGRTRVMVNYGVVWGITVTTYICEYDHLTKTVHFSQRESTTYPWKRATLLLSCVLLGLIGCGRLMRGDKKPDYIVYGLFIFCLPAVSIFITVCWADGIRVVDIPTTFVCLFTVSFVVLKLSQSFFAKRLNKQ